MSYTPSLRLNQMTTGSRTNTWGIGLNDEVIGLVDAAISGVSTITVVGDMTLTSLNGQPDQARAAHLVLIGSPAANFQITIPNVSKLYRVTNATGRMGTFSAGGATASVDTGDIVDIECDGTDVTTPGYGGLSLKDYISSVAAGGPGGNVPSVIGQSGKWLTNNGALPFWSPISALQLSDYSTKILGAQVALAVSL